jgi:hypothetical protein
MMYRSVGLTEGWYKDAYGPMLAFMKDTGTPVALLPGKIKGYTYTDPATGKKLKLNRSRYKLFDTGAICFYRPLPQKKLKIADLILYMQRWFASGQRRHIRPL